MKKYTWRRAVNDTFTEIEKIAAERKQLRSLRQELDPIGVGYLRRDEVHLCSRPRLPERAATYGGGIFLRFLPDSLSKSLSPGRRRSMRALPERIARLRLGLLLWRL